jgi:hypothetical protein
MQPSATGAHQRVRMYPAGVPLPLHATIIPGSYDFTSGAFQAFFDVQDPGTPPLSFAKVAGHKALYTDDTGLEWQVLE